MLDDVIDDMLDDVIEDMLEDVIEVIHGGAEWFTADKRPPRARLTRCTLLGSVPIVKLCINEN